MFFKNTRACGRRNFFIVIRVPTKKFACFKKMYFFFLENYQAMIYVQRENDKNKL